MNWLKTKHSRTDMKLNRFGMKTNYYDTDFLDRRTAVKNLADAALTEIYPILDNAGALDRTNSSRLKVDRNKMETLATLALDRKATKGMDDSYAYERDSYLESGKTKAMSGSAVHSVHGFVNNLVQNGQLEALGVNLTSKQRATLNKDVDQLSPQDWQILDALGQTPEVNQSADVIDLKKQNRLNMMVSVDAAGKLVDADDSPFSTRQGQPGIFAMDRYGNLFIEPPNFNAGTDFFNHSSFNSGNEVICAGEVVVENGVSKTINNGSGHYKPTRDNLLNCVSKLNEFGADLSQAQVRIFGAGAATIPAATFLANG